MECKCKTTFFQIQVQKRGVRCYSSGNSVFRRSGHNSSPISKTSISDLHFGHMGIDKIKSLKNLTCWWPGMDNLRVFNSCKSVYVKHILIPLNGSHGLSCKAWEWIHVDYRGPAFNKCWALVIVYSYSHWHEVYFTNSADVQFTITDLLKTFIR